MYPGLSNIYDGAFCKYSLRLKAVNYFRKKTLCIVLTGSLVLLNTDGFSRSSHRRCSVRKGVHRNFLKFARKHLCQSVPFNNVAGLSLRTPFLQNTSWRMLLFIEFSSFCLTTNFNVANFPYKRNMCNFRIKNFWKFNCRGVCGNIKFNKNFV